MIAQHLRLRKAAKTAGVVVFGIIALDIALSAVTVAFGWELLRR